eukprot:221393-Amphidinium_carterae.1
MVATPECRDLPSVAQRIVLCAFVGDGVTRRLDAQADAKEIFFASMHGYGNDFYPGTKHC